MRYSASLNYKHASYFRILKVTKLDIRNQYEASID